MIRIDDRITLDQEELKWSFVKSSGPGGQNVNKVATAVQLRFDAVGSPSLPEDVKERLLQIAGKRVSREGVLVIEARRHRSQDRNRREALSRLVGLIRAAARKPKTRRETRPGLEAERRRVAEKRRRGRIKRLRRQVSDEE